MWILSQNCFSGRVVERSMYYWTNGPRVCLSQGSTSNVSKEL
jgi:hypothetical protein